MSTELYLKLKLYTHAAQKISGHFGARHCTLKTANYKTDDHIFDTPGKADILVHD